MQSALHRAAIARAPQRNTQPLTTLAHAVPFLFFFSDSRLQKDYILFIVQNAGVA